MHNVTPQFAGDSAWSRPGTPQRSETIMQDLPTAANKWSVVSAVVFVSALFASYLVIVFTVGSS